MARPKKSDLTDEMHKIVSGKPPATAKEQENRLVSLAMKRAEQQLLDGTASSQVITHYLKLGTSREKLEQEKIQYESEVLKAKAQSFQDAKDAAVQHEQILEAMRLYGGGNDE